MPRLRRAQTDIFEHQADASIAQAAPVQNTWYTVLDTIKNGIIYQALVVVADTNETLEMRITVDGNVLDGSVSATAGSSYFAVLQASADDELNLVLSTDTSNRPKIKDFVVQGRSIKIEVRKTTAAGTGTITARVKHAKIP